MLSNKIVEKGELETAEDNCLEFVPCSFSSLLSFRLTIHFLHSFKHTVIYLPDKTHDIFSLDAVHVRFLN